MTAPESSDTTTPPTSAAPGQSATSEAQTEGSPQVAAEAIPAEMVVAFAKELAEAKQAAARNHEHYVRAMADLENFRRRAIREKDELRQFAAGKVLEDLLPVLDNLGLAIAAAKAPNADLKKLVDGIDMVLGQMKTSLSNHGLKEIAPLRQPFDPNQHESISSQPSAEVAEGSVAQVVRVGYSLNGRLLRAASVVVSSGPAKEPDKC